MEELEKKMFNLTMNINIERSNKVNTSRLLRMKARNECVLKIKDEVKDALLK